MLRILLLHVPALAVVAVSFGYASWHAAVEIAVVLAVVLGAASVRSQAARALLATTALLSCSALLVHFTGGLIEAHFHFFVAVALLAFYEDRRVYVLAVAFVLLHHGVIGTQFTETTRVFEHPSYPGVSAWTWAGVHAGFILMAGLANMLLAHINERSREVATREVERRACAEAAAAVLTAAFTPSPLPSLTGRADVAAAYRPGEGAVGGDFYNVVDVGDGRIAIGVGDVAGHGPHAGGLGSRLRHTLRAYSSDGLEPAAVMDKLERSLGSDGSATCAYLLVDPAAETVTSSLAGHLPPVVVRPDGGIHMLGGGLSVPLAGLGVPHVQETRPLPAGSTVIVYTDGLVERRDESIDVGLRRLRDAIAAIGPDPGAICQSLPERLLRGVVQADDIALVALRTEAVNRVEEAPPLQSPPPRRTTTRSGG